MDLGNDMFMTTLGGEMGFELGDFAKKGSGGKTIKTWHYKGEGGNIDASVKVFNGHVFIASVDRRVYKIDPETGNKVWDFKADGIFGTSGPEVSNGRVFIGDRAHNFYCIDDKNGKEIWRFRTGDTIDASPLVVNDMVVFTSKDFFVYALDTETGKMLWAFRTGGWAGFTPVTDGESIFVGSSDCYLYCLSFNGNEKWRFKTNGNIFTKDDVPILDGIIYFGSDDGNIYGVDVKTGKEVWRFRTGGIVNRPPAIKDGRLYVLSHDGYFYCIDIETCRAVWRFNTSSCKGGTKAVLLEDRITFASEDFNMYCLDNDGKLMWKFRTGGHIWGTPAYYKGNIFLGSYDCRLYCLDLDGNVLWRFETSILNQATCIIEFDTGMEFNPPEVKEVEHPEDRKKYSSSENQVTHESTYSVKSEYVFKSEYA